MVDQSDALYDGTGPSTKIAIWDKQTGAGQSYMQSVANSLYWGDGKSQKKWLTTLQDRIPYVQSPFPLSQNPYNFTPYELNTFIVDPNGDAEQLIGTILQLNNFYILNDTIVFSLITSSGGISLPQVYEVLESGLQVYFGPTSQIAEVLGQTNGVTLTIQNIVGAIINPSVYVGGAGYTVGDTVNVNQISPAGSMNGQLHVSSTGSATGHRYVTANNLQTTTSKDGLGAVIDIIASNGGLVSATVVSGGTSYAVNDYVYPTQGNAYGGAFRVSSVSGGAITGLVLATGCVTGVTIVDAGMGYYTADNVPTTGGTGVGLTVDIENDETEFSCNVIYGGGAVTGESLAVPGTGYTVNDLLEPQQPTQPTAAGLILKVTAISGTASALSFGAGGPTIVAYTTGATTYTTSGAGIGATFTISTVSGGNVTGVTVGAGGSGFSVGDLIYLTQGSAAGAILSVATLTGSAIATVTITQGGYTPYTTASGVATTTSGSGTGLTINITGVTAGAITSGGWNLAAGGTGYSIGDKVYPVQSTASGAYFTVTTLSSTTGPIVSLSLVDAGTGYVSGTNLPVTGGTGTGAEVNIVVANEAFYPLTSTTDIPPVYSGGNPISDSRVNSAVVWGGVGEETIDGSALWINRGPVVDGGLVYNWGLAGGTSAPAVVVNNATGAWEPDTYYNQWQFIVVNVSGSFYLMMLLTSGKSGSVAPTWNTVVGQNTTDGTAVWRTLGNDGDTTLAWAAAAEYSVGHVLQETTGGVSCIFQLQPYSGVMTEGTDFPVYCWQCNGQSGSDVGAAGQIPSGGGNAAMAQDGGQPVSTATYSGTMNSLFLSAAGGSNPIATSAIAGDGTVSSSSVQLFPGSQNLSMLMQPKFVFPAAGIYEFTVTHMNSWFWGMGNGSLDLDIIQILIQGNQLTARSNKDISQILSPGVVLTFSGLTGASFLNGVTVTVTSATGRSFTADYTHANYGPAVDSGTASSGATLTPTVISGPLNWENPGSPNTYDFATGTPVGGLPIMAANYVASGTAIYTDTVQISVPSAGVYPSEIYQGVWYHSIPSYTQPTTSPVLPSTKFSFSMIYTPPGSSTNYNIIPEGIACSNASPPTWPSFPTTLAGIQAIAPAYPNVTEASGNFTWWNLGPATTFDWNASVNMTTETFIIDPNNNEELPYESGVSGTTEPTFSLTLYGCVADLPALVWMNNGPLGNTPSGTLTTTQGGWRYVVSLVNTLDTTVSNASPASVVTGNFFSASSVFISGGIPESPDPQADYVAIFRTDDGGATYFLIPPPASGNGNTEFTIPLAQYLAEGFTDTNTDQQLNTLLEAPIDEQNSVPPKGAINLAFNYGRLFCSVKNVVYWSTGSNTPVGNGYDAFSPNNYAEFPSLVTRIVPLNIGTIVFTISDIYLIAGNGSVSNPFDPQPFISRVGLLNYNALTVNGSIIYFMSTDLQVLELNVHTAISNVGFNIADQFLINPWSPATSYLTWHVNGSNDQCLFTADGSTGWFRMAPTSPPENGTITWSLKANLVGGCKCVQSVETTPGNIQLLIGPVGTGPILYRDYNNFTDNGTPYPANFILGSMVMAHPGQLAGVEFITTECIRASGALPISLGIRMGEISGDFEDLVFWDTDPPQLPPSESLYAQRFYLSQTKFPSQSRHMQVYAEFAETNSADELLTLTVYGGYSQED